MGLTRRVTAQGEQIIGFEVLPESQGSLIQNALHLPADLLWDGPAAHQQIEDAAEDREGKDHKQPGDLVGGLHPAAYDGQSGKNAEQDTAPIEMFNVFREDGHHGDQSGDLSQQSQRHKDRAVEQNVKNFLHGAAPPCGTVPCQGWRWMEQWICPCSIRISP